MHFINNRHWVCVCVWGGCVGCVGGCEVCLGVGEGVLFCFFIQYSDIKICRICLLLSLLPQTEGEEFNVGLSFTEISKWSKIDNYYVIVTSYTGC